MVVAASDKTDVTMASELSIISLHGYILKWGNEVETIQNNIPLHVWYYGEKFTVN